MPHPEEFKAETAALEAFKRGMRNLNTTPQRNDDAHAFLWLTIHALQKSHDRQARDTLAEMPAWFRHLVAN
jgi:hypothetical protein